ncbi:MAG TPA: fructosamine kinase family protein [Kofleriaceae bacterium]|nr:fructosamine kinase family protein [Kofleriaceae bacterium]
MTGWKAELSAALGARVAAAEPVAGGDINDAYRVRLVDGRVVFVKTHADPPPGMFEAEAHGLDWLRDGPLRVPRVLAAGPHFLALEWLDVGGRGQGFDEALGRGLAALHRLGAPCFGLPRDGYLATLPQPRIELADGPAFWIEHRVRPLVERARVAGRMPDVSARLDALRARPDRFGPPEPPARLHGDLWWGNVVAADGAPVLVDPAVYGGHREVDLAMLALFGSLPEALARAYDEVFPLAPGWRERRLLWQLYPLAAHAVLFGGGYGAQVMRALDALT